MRIGVPTEVKNNEYRVALTPGGVNELGSAGTTCWCSRARARARGYHDADTPRRVPGSSRTPPRSGAPRPAAQGEGADDTEYGFLRDGQTLFTYLHLAADRPLVDALVASGTTAIGYETVQLPDRSLPLLIPMSEVAGRLSAQVGAYHLLKPERRRGAAARRRRRHPEGEGRRDRRRRRPASTRRPPRSGLGADVTVIDVALPRLRQLEARFGDRIQTPHLDLREIADQVRDADLVVGSVLIPGERAPKLVTDEMVAAMRPGSVLVDIAIDQGGCFEGSRPTTHDDPDVPGARLRLLLRRQHARRGARHVDARADERDAALRAVARGRGVRRRRPPPTRPSPRA